MGVYFTILTPVNIFSTFTKPFESTGHDNLFKPEDFLVNTRKFNKFIYAVSTV